MAIKDIQQQLIKSEGQSGEFLIKKIKTDLVAVYMPDMVMKHLLFLIVIGNKHLKNLVMKQVVL